MAGEVSIIEVGPRDGLQNEPVPVPTEEKAAFIRALGEAGLKEIEATSFVSPKWVPQLGDAAELWRLLPPGPSYSALVPNRKGLDRALAAGVKRIALFTAASESFTQKNINMTVDESVTEFAEVVLAFRSEVADGFVRGYISTVVDCPFEGRIAPDKVAALTKRLFEVGVDEVCLGETLGTAVPSDIRLLLRSLAYLKRSRLSWHFHDTRGTALANVVHCLDAGYRRFDSSAGGLGGCPYAPGAGGNLATEDLVYLLERTGYHTGVNLNRLARASLSVLGRLGKAPTAKAQLAALSTLP